MAKTGQVNRLLFSYFGRYLKYFDEVYFFSYKKENYPMPERCHLVPAKVKTKGLIYSFLMPVLCWKEIRRCHLFRVLQMTGVVPAIIAKILWGIPFVATYGYIYKSRVEIERGKFLATVIDFITRTGLKFADAVIVTSKDTLHFLNNKVSREKVHFIPNGADLSVLKPVFAKNHKNGKQVFSIGRLTKEKNYHLLIDAVSKLSNVSLTIIGNGPLHDELRRYGKEKNVKVAFIDAVPNEKLPEILKDADIFVLPSLFEGHSKALTDAMACGLPCIGTNVEGIRDIIIDGENGLLCGLSAKDLTNKINLVLQDPAFGKKLAENARKYVEEHFDLDKLLKKEIKIMVGVVKRYA